MSGYISETKKIRTCTYAIAHVHVLWNNNNVNKYSVLSYNLQIPYQVLQFIVELTTSFLINNSISRCLIIITVI